jgi:photosystem II stability/assembly factor-like uncharacterized protein
METGSEMCRKKPIHLVHGLFLVFLVAVSAHSRWEETGLTTENAFFSLYSSEKEVFARTWDPFDGASTWFSTDSGETWDRMGASDSSTDILSLITLDDMVLAGTWDGYSRFLPTSDAWRALSRTGIPAQTPIWSTANVSRVLFAGSDGAVYVSSDSGVTWSERASGLPENARIITLAGYEDTVFAGTDSMGIYRTVNGGSRWYAVNTGLDNTHILQICRTGTRLFAVTLQGVFISEDNGRNWEAAEDELDGANCLLNVNSFLLAGTDSNGVLVSDDGGDTWGQNTAGLPEAARVWSLTFCSGNIFAGTDAGVWRSPYESIGVKKDRPGYAGRFSLSIRRADHSRTTVSFTLSRPAMVGLGLYDLSGNRIVISKLKHYGAGLHGIPLDTRVITSGSYIIRLIEGNKVHQRTVILQR